MPHHLSLYQTATDFPVEVQTVGAALAAGNTIEATCPRCWGARAVDLARIISFHGPGYSLIDRQTACTFRPGCDGRVRFRYIGEYGMKTMESEKGRAWRASRDR